MLRTHRSPHRIALLRGTWSETRACRRVGSLFTKFKTVAPQLARKRGVADETDCDWATYVTVRTKTRRGGIAMCIGKASQLPSIPQWLRVSPSRRRFITSSIASQAIHMVPMTHPILRALLRDRCAFPVPWAEGDRGIIQCAHNACKWYNKRAERRQESPCTSRRRTRQKHSIQSDSETSTPGPYSRKPC